MKLLQSLNVSLLYKVYNTKQVTDVSSTAQSNSLDICITVTTKLNTNENLCTKITRKLCYRKDDRAMRPTLWVPLKFSGLPDYAHGHYSQCRNV